MQAVRMQIGGEIFCRRSWAKPVRSKTVHRYEGHGCVPNEACVSQMPLCQVIFLSLFYTVAGRDVPIV